MATERRAKTIEALYREERTFLPPPDFAARANARDRAIYERAERDLEGFWAEEAKRLEWSKPFATADDP